MSGTIFRVGNVFELKYNGFSMIITEVNYSENKVTLKILTNGEHKNKIVTRSIRRLNEMVTNGLLLVYRLVDIEQKFSMEPLKFVNEKNKVIITNKRIYDEW
jgi:hypothetical protein